MPLPIPKPRVGDPTLTGFASIYCPDPTDKTNKRINLGLTLSGGGGDWSCKAQIGLRLISLGTLQGAGGTFSTDTFVNCKDGDAVAVIFTASGFGRYSPKVLRTTKTSECKCQCEPLALNLLGGESVDVCNGSSFTYEEQTEECQTTVGVMLRNAGTTPLNVSIGGDVDDDVLIDGSIYQAGAPFPWDGAVGFAYSGVLAPGAILRIQGKDNDFGGWINCQGSFWE